MSSPAGLFFSLLKKIVMKKILIINGHPNAGSLGNALHLAYRAGALESNAEVNEIRIGELQFNPNLQYGYQQRTELEPDLLLAWEKIQWADHLVWIHPVWWGGWPAIMKGFVDRLFLPGMAFKYRENSVWWDKLLAGKTARIITTMDQPTWYYRLMSGAPSIRQLKNSTLGFCGVKPVRVTAFGPVRGASATKIEGWIKAVRLLGHQQR